MENDSIKVKPNKWLHITQTDLGEETLLKGSGDYTPKGVSFAPTVSQALDALPLFYSDEENARENGILKGKGKIRKFVYYVYTPAEEYEAVIPEKASDYERSGERRVLKNVRVKKVGVIDVTSRESYSGKQIYDLVYKWRNGESKKRLSNRKDMDEKVIEPEVVWVDSWRDVPEADPNNIVHRMTRAVYFTRQNKIYAVKNKATKYLLEHEKYHANKINKYIESESKKYPNKSREQILEDLWEIEKKKPYYGLEDDVAEEFEAYKYAYDRTSKPKHLNHQLLAMYDWLTDRTKPQNEKDLYVEIKPSKVMKWLRKGLMAVDPPEEWVDDYSELEEDYHEAYSENKDDPNTIYYNDKEYFSEKNKSLNNKKFGKDWWNDDFYNNKRSIRRVKKVVYKSFFGVKLLPPNLNGKL